MDPDPHEAGASPKTRPGASVPDPDSVEVKMAEKDGFFFLLLLEESLREEKLSLEPDLGQSGAELRSGTNDSGSIYRRGSGPMWSQIHHTMKVVC